jgi:ABC-type lipoprotein release transport system permease subunit
MYAKLVDQAVRQQAGHITVEHPAYRAAPAIDLAVGGLADKRRVLAALPGVVKTKAVIQGQGVAKTGSAQSGVAILAVEPDAERDTSPIAQKIRDGAFLADGDERLVVLGRGLAERLKLEPGKKLVLTTTDTHGQIVEELFRVKGIFATGADEIDGYLVLIPLTFAQRFLDLGTDRATQLGVLVEEPQQRDRVLAQARDALAGAEVAVLPWERVMPDLAAYIRLDRGSNLVVQGVLVFLSLFTIFNTVLMSVLERRREFAMMLALGTSPWRVRGQVLCEAALLGLLGCCAGLLVGGSAGYLLELYGLDLSVFMAEGVSVSGFAIDTRVFADVSPSLLFALGGAVLAAVVLTSSFAVRHVSRIPIATVLR